MRPFTYIRAEDERSALELAEQPAAPGGPTAAPVQFLAGGTNLLDFMKLSCWTAEALVDINDLEATHGAIRVAPDGVHLGALVRMSRAGDHPDLRRDYPVLAQSLNLAASAQLRNMASLGGNVLQRTRCAYFRDPGYRECNKRDPGSGCAAIGGNNRFHAVLGVGPGCISSYPGDFAQALMALDATVEVVGPGRSRTLPFGELHTGPEDPAVETVLSPGELIRGFFVPAGPHTRRSVYVKVRDRASYEYGVATAAVAIDLGAGRVVRDVRIALGGVAYRPWRARVAEGLLKGKPLTEDAAGRAGAVAFEGSVVHGENAFKPRLGALTVKRALLEASRLEP